MANRSENIRPCSAILQSSLRPTTCITGNNSSSIWQCMTWGNQGNPRNIQCAHNEAYLSQSAHLEPNRNLVTKCGCCQNGQYTSYSPRSQYNNDRGRTAQHQGKVQIQTQQKGKSNFNNYTSKQKQIRGQKYTNTRLQQKQTIRNAKSSTQTKQASRNRSPTTQVVSPSYDRMEIQQVKKRRLNDLMKSKEKSLERIKVEQYVQSQRPFTRGMPDSRFRTLFGKQCMEAYGRNNTNEPIGGVIYGNNLKTFNINPHSSSNDPKHYQTHTTALNFAKRTKLDQQKNWKLLQKELGKELQLQAVNQTLIPGKQVVYQEVTPDNMYAAMRVNHQFAKNNRQQIRQQERDYKRQQVLDQWAKQDQYKAQRAADKQALKGVGLGSTMAMSQIQDEFRRAGGSVQQKLGQQIIYKMKDENGCIRYGADRHAMTCFVDTNFPENQTAYTAQLMNRNPIFPKKVKEQDRHLDQIRKQNYVQSVVNNYPAHYLLPNVDLSKVVLKPRAQSKRKSPQRQKRPQSSNPYYTNNKVQIQNQPIFQNTKVGANVNRNVVNSPKGQNKNNIQTNNNQKTNYFNQSTKVSYGSPQKIQSNYQTNVAGNSRYPPTHGQAGQSSQEACARYANTLKNALLEQSTRNPHFATQLLVKASQNTNTIPPKNQRVVNEQYDSRDHYPHANHEMKPKLHTHIKATKIPYAGVESNRLNAIQH